ncbi:MICAL-like protein 1 [Parambassis ranga]|uniref:MICAL-like protein 1 n=1 Tax=Parambassis ranga TaxID=210632 RepID=A0A6P7IVX6_9TELE|nr:MICAL-like protein 1 [Parambassis ranga]
MTSPKALLEWCRATCASYPGVEIKNMSSSFRDGLAFCAIIHSHRPDLIDFSSLSKDNVYHNNKLAFEVAESQLGITALLDPKDMVSTKVPDCLSVISYLCQYYFFFNRKSLAAARSWSSHSSVLNHLTKSRRSGGLKRLKSLSDLGVSGDDGFSNTKPRTVCSLCLKPVHLIQRCLIDGKVYHRSCFRCKLCRSTLLAESYTQGSDSGSLICSYHTTDGTNSQLGFNQQTGSADNETGYYSLDGAAIARVPHYTKKTESQDGLVCKARGAAVTESTDRGDASAGPPRPLRQNSSVNETKTSELSASCAHEGRTHPVPAPRRLLHSSTVPVPAPRTKTCQTMNSKPAAGSLSPPGSSQVTSPKVKTNHPWMSIVHPGPWTQLPPAPPPVPAPRSKSVSRPRPRIPPPNPFEEEEEEDADTKPESTDRTEPSVAAVVSKPAVSIPTGEPEDKEGSVLETKSTSGKGLSSKVTEDTAQNHGLPRSLSVPVITPDHAQTGTESVTLCQSQAACRGNPFNQKPALTKSHTFQDVSSSRGPAPGHGFPLIKRKVQSEQAVSTENLQVQTSEVEKHLEVLEQRGVELERNLRGCTHDKEEDRMLMEWFSLIHERHVLLRRDAELVYLTMQQKLEDRQADVEYKLRCLLNKPESDWSQEDRGREEQLMNELVSIIEQRNRIISVLDQDRQREREEDVQWEDVMKNKHLQKEELKEMKKSKGKFKPTKVFKMLNHKAESTKEAAHKQS